MNFGSVCIPRKLISGTGQPYNCSRRRDATPRLRDATPHLRVQILQADFILAYSSVLSLLWNVHSLFLLIYLREKNMLQGAVVWILLPLEHTNQDCLLNWEFWWGWGMRTQWKRLLPVTHIMSSTLVSCTLRHKANKIASFGNLHRDLTLLRSL